MEENEGSEAQLGGGREIRGNMSERKPSFSPCSYLPCPPRLRGDARDPASPPVFRRPLQPSRRRPRTQAGPPKPQHVSTCQPPSADPIQRSSVKSLPAPLTLVTSINSCQSLSTLFDLAPPHLRLERIFSLCLFCAICQYMGLAQCHVISRVVRE